MNATTFPLPRSRSNLSVPLAALLTGAALSAGVMALADTDELTSPPAKVIVVEAPASSAKGVNEAAVASAIAPGIELRGSKASATGSTTPSTVPPADETRLGGPRGLPSGLNGR